MHLFQGDRSQSLALLFKIGTVLGVLLILLAVFALLGDVLGFLGRFKAELYLFVLGALLAYLLTPAVRVLQHVVRKQWAAILATYLLMFAAVVVFGALLLTPFVSQAQSLLKNMRDPSAASLVRLHTVQHDLGTVQAAISAQQRLLVQNRPILQQQMQQTQSSINNILQEATALTATVQTNHNLVSIPPSYAAQIVPDVRQLATTYAQAASTVDAAQLASAASAASVAQKATTAVYQKAASTPVLLLNLQMTADQHGMVIDLHDRFSQVIQSINNQVSSLLNNALNISLQAGNLLLDVVLMFIISIYFVKDGGRFVQWLVHQMPAASRADVTRAVASLDRILGSYLRTQVILALLAGTSDAVGATVLGIPYAIVIFVSSFLLSLVPVLGPVLLPLPPLGLALLFTPLPKPLIFLIWLLVGEQLITNVVGPRLQAHTLRIHPLEAMAAALGGLPLAGLAGAFFAVPVLAFVHIVLREYLLARTLAGREPRDGPAAPPRPAVRNEPTV